MAEDRYQPPGPAVVAATAALLGRGSWPAVERALDDERRKADPEGGGRDG